MAKLNWKGAQLRAKIAEATLIALDRTMSEAVSEAKRQHPWHNRTGWLEASTWMMGPATIDGAKVTGRWGSTANYALYLEIGTSRRGSGAPRAEARKAMAGGNMNEISPPLPLDHPLMRPHPYLRPAADRQYRLLRVRIGQAMRGEELT